MIRSVESFIWESVFQCSQSVLYSGHVILLERSFWNLPRHGLWRSDIGGGGHRGRSDLFKLWGNRRNLSLSLHLFDPARPKITERKRMIVPNAYGFGYPGYWCGGWTVVGYGGWYIPGSLCGYNVWSGYGVWPSRFTINIRL